MTANPLFWLNFRLAGAWRSLLTGVGLLSAAVLVFAGISYRMASPGAAAGVSGTWLGIITLAQSAFLLLAAPAAVRKAVLRDFQTGMIESHRLSPMSGLKVVLGYLTGAPVLVYVLYALGLVFGSFFVGHYTLSVGVPQAAGSWYFVQGCLVLLSFMICSIILLVALSTSGKTNVVGLLIIGLIFGGWTIVAVVPGLALMTGLMSVDLLFAMVSNPRAGGTLTGNPLVLPLAALTQLVFGTIFVLASARKVRYPERAMFSIPLVLTLLATWAATLVLGVALLPAKSNISLGFEEVGAAAQVIGSAIAFMLVALLAVVAAAVELYHVDRAAAFDRTALRRAIPPLLMPLLLAAAMAGLTLLLATMHRNVDALPAGILTTLQDRPWRIALFCAALLTFWTDLALVYVAVAQGTSVFRRVLIAALVLKVGPLLFDGGAIIAYEQVDRDWTPADLGFSGGSPVGTYVLSALPAMNPWPGIIMQGVIAGLATWWALSVRKRLFQGAATTPVARPAV
ncbi:MAG: hypothetical protein AB7Q17_05850 [Phycisphaerae bacterium]